LENCVHGDAFEVTQGIHDKSSNASENARTAGALTLLHDQAKGLAKMHGEGVTHQDYKGPNVMVAKGGVGKIADFGTSGGQKVDGRTGGVEITVAKDNVENPTWVSPLRLYGREAKANAQLAKSNELKKAAIHDVCQMMGLHSIETSGKLNKVKLKDYDVQELQRRHGPEEGKKIAKRMEDDLNAVLTKIDKQVETEFAPKTMTFNEKADVWAFGIVAYQMLFNKGSDLPPQFQDSFLSNIEEKLKAHRAAGLKGEGKPIFDGPPESLTAQEKFVNWLLPPKEEDAPSMEQVVNHPIFKDLLGEGVVGSKEARDFIESSANLSKAKGDAMKPINEMVKTLNEDALAFDAGQFTTEMEQRFPLEPKSPNPWYPPKPNYPPQWNDEIGNLLSRAPLGQIDALAQDIVQTLMLDAKQGESIMKAAALVKQQKTEAADAQLKASRLDAIID